MENDLRDPEIYGQFMLIAERHLKRKCKKLNSDAIIGLLANELGRIHRNLNLAFDFVEENSKEKTAQLLNIVLMHYEYSQFLIENWHESKRK